jgi:tetratricopeptide (TPR) repeat protein
MSAAYQSGLKLSSQGRHVEAIAQFEQALAQDPADTKVLFALGNTASQLGLAGAAEQFFRQVLALEPGRLEAIVNLANLLRAAGQLDAAIALLEPALARQPDSPELLITLGSAFREKSNFQQARAHYEAALAARPNYGPAMANLADMLCDAGDRKQARTLYDQAVKADPKNSRIRLNRAVLHLLNGDLKDGWRDYAARTEVPGKVPVVAGEQRLAPWTGGPLKRTRLLVRAEQGVGDQILFASLIPELAARAKAEGGSVILECEPRLVPLFARSFPEVMVRPALIKTLGGVPTADYGWLKAAGGANAAVLMGGVPKYLRGTLEGFPKPHTFLVPDAQERAHWRSVFKAQGDKKIIGISWRSGKAGGGDRMLQYAPLEDWARFLKATDATFVCAQYAATEEEIAALQEMSGRKILVPETLDQKNELDRTCAMLAALDVVISAPTAVSWLAAGAGVPTLKLLAGPVWTAMGQSHEPFAPACKCLSADRIGNWADVFRQAADSIRN